jgi:hypothetical protein
VFDFDIVPIYSSINSMANFDTPTVGSIKVVLSGKAFYPEHEIMARHNLEEFGRGNLGKFFEFCTFITFVLGEYFPRITVELCNELTKNDLRVDDMFLALLCFIHPPHQPVQQKYVRLLLIFAHANRMAYLLNSMENVSFRCLECLLLFLGNHR